MLSHVMRVSTFKRLNQVTRLRFYDWSILRAEYCVQNREILDPTKALGKREGWENNPIPPLAPALASLTVSLAHFVCVETKEAR